MFAKVFWGERDLSYWLAERACSRAWGFFANPKINIRIKNLQYYETDRVFIRSMLLSSAIMSTGNPEKDKSKVHKLSLKGEFQKNSLLKKRRADRDTYLGSSKLIAEFVSSQV